MSKNIAVALGGVVLGLILGFALPHEKAAEVGGSVYNRVIEFSEGITVDGTTRLDGSGNVTAVDLSASDDLSVSDDATITDQLTADEACFGSSCSASTVAAVVIRESSASTTLAIGTPGQAVCIQAPACAMGDGSCAGDAPATQWYTFSSTGVSPIGPSKPSFCP